MLIPVAQCQPFKAFLLRIFSLPQAYNIHVNGVLHCRVRYSQLLGLHEQVNHHNLLICCQCALDQKSEACMRGAPNAV